MLERELIFILISYFLRTKIFLVKRKLALNLSLLNLEKCMVRTVFLMSAKYTLTNTNGPNQKTKQLLKNEISEFRTIEFFKLFFNCLCN